MTTSLPSAGGHVLLSGGSRGLGQALVRALLSAGYRVSTFARRSTPFLDSLATEPAAFVGTADMADEASLRAFVAAAGRRFGPPWGLVNCAGVAIDGVLASMAPSDVEKMMSTNLTGAMLLTRLVLRTMLLQRQGGAIVNISSIIASRGYSGLAAYAATKGGMDAMTRALARELGDRGIRVNSIAPGYLETEMTHGLTDQQREMIVRRTPLGRLGRPEDVVGPLLFLLSDAAGFVTGQTLTVDGGTTC
ncbi:MAG: SDR family oxidoreductase [Planctomycetes bacterium]|nr:SDR family oxidoreductase [Planctomycetota bacterium]